MDGQPRSLRTLSHRHRTGRRPNAERRPRPRQQPLELGVVSLYAGRQATVSVEQPIAFPEETSRPVVRLHNPALPVDLDDAETVVVEQIGQRASQRLGIGQRLPDAHEMAHMRQKVRDHSQLGLSPSLRVRWSLRFPSRSVNPRGRSVAQ